MLQSRAVSNRDSRNIGSTASLKGLENSSAYVSPSTPRSVRANLHSTSQCASKHAVLGFSRAMAIEYARNSIRVNVIAPGPLLTSSPLPSLTSRKGPIDTPLLESLLGPTEVTVEEACEVVPMQRLGKASEVATVVAFLLGPDSSYVTVRSSSALERRQLTLRFRVRCFRWTEDGRHSGEQCGLVIPCTQFFGRIAAPLALLSQLLLFLESTKLRLLAHPNPIRTMNYELNDELPTNKPPLLPTQADSDLSFLPNLKIDILFGFFSFFVGADSTIVSTPRSTVPTAATGPATSAGRMKEAAMGVVLFASMGGVTVGEVAAGEVATGEITGEVAGEVAASTVEEAGISLVTMGVEGTARAVPEIG